MGCDQDIHARWWTAGGVHRFRTVNGRPPNTPISPFSPSVHAGAGQGGRSAPILIWLVVGVPVRND